MPVTMSVRFVTAVYPALSVRRAIRTSGPSVDAKQTNTRRLVAKSGARSRLIIPDSDMTSRAGGFQSRILLPPATMARPSGRSVYTIAFAGLAFARVQPQSHGKLRPPRVRPTEGAGGGRQPATTATAARTTTAIRMRIRPGYPIRAGSDTSAPVPPTGARQTTAAPTGVSWLNVLTQRPSRRHHSELTYMASLGPGSGARTYTARYERSTASSATGVRRGSEISYRAT